MKLSTLIVSSLLASSVLLTGCNETKNDFYGNNSGATPSPTPTPPSYLADCELLDTAEECLDNAVGANGFGIAVHVELNGEQFWLVDNQGSQANFTSIANNIITVGKTNGAAALEIEEGALDAAYVTGAVHVCEDIGGDYAIIMKNAELNGNFDSKNGTSCYIKVIDNDRASFKASFYGHVSDNGTALEIIDGYARVKLPPAPDLDAEAYLNDAIGANNFGIAALVEVNGVEQWIFDKQDSPNDGFVSFDTRKTNPFGTVIQYLNFLKLGAQTSRAPIFDFLLDYGAADINDPNARFNERICGALGGGVASTFLKFTLNAQTHTLNHCNYTTIQRGIPGDANTPFIATFDSYGVIKKGYLRVVLPPNNFTYSVTKKLNNVITEVQQSGLPFITYGKQQDGTFEGFYYRFNSAEIGIAASGLNPPSVTIGSPSACSPAAYDFKLIDSNNAFYGYTQLDGCTISIESGHNTNCKLEFLISMEKEVSPGEVENVDVEVLIDNTNNPDNDCN